MDHALRRTRLAAQLPSFGIDALLVTKLVNVRYLTGFGGSNAQLIVGDDVAVFFTDARYDVQSARQVPDLPRVVYPAAFVEHLADTVRDAKVRRLGFESTSVSYKLFSDLAETGVELVPVEQAVERLRWSKDEEEVRLIERAQAVTDDAFESLLPTLREGLTEIDLAAELEHLMRGGGAERVGFDTIVAFGENAAEPHHHPADRRLRRGDLVKLDFGCVVEGYHSDMTRTVAFGEPEPELREVFDIVRKAQAEGVAAVRAGVSGADVDGVARGVIADAGYGDRFGHSLGHGIGLEVHEGPTLRRTSDDVLPEGAVVTVEPGVYLPGLGGVRIEDMVVVGRDGARPLPRSTRDLIVL